MAQNRQPGPIGGCIIGPDTNADLLFAAIAGSRVPSLLTDPNQAANPIVHANRAFGDLTGYSEEELPGRDFAALLQGAGNAGALVRLDTAIAGRTAIELELEICRKDGTGLRCALFASPVQGADGRLRYFFCTLLDIARRVAELSGRENAGDLHELARSVGHEFNNLLTIIRTNLELLQQEAADPLTEKRLDRVALGVDRATELVRTFVAKVRGAGPPARPGSPGLPRARGGETILVVEPDEVLGAQAGAMLRGLGYQVQTVADAKAALRWLSGAARVDLMLARSDDGLALAKRTRVKGLPVLYSTESTAPRGGDTVGRPFQIIALARAIRAAIDGAGKSSR